MRCSQANAIHPSAFIHRERGRGLLAANLQRDPGCDPCGPEGETGKRHRYKQGTFGGLGAIDPEQRSRCDILRSARDLAHRPSMGQ